MGINNNNKRTVTLNGANKIKVIYFGVSILFLLLPFITYGFFGAISISGFNMAFQSFNFITLYMLAAIAGFVLEVVPQVRSIDFYQKNKKVVDMLLPAVMVLAILYLVITNFGFRNEILGGASLSEFVYLNFVVQVAYAVYTFFPKQFQKITSKFKD